MNARGISLTQAQAIVVKSLKLARQHNCPPLSITVLDNGGHLKAFASEDGSGTMRGKIAEGKANAALAMGFDTKQFHQLVKQGVLPEMFANCINGASDGHFIPLPGGVLIVDTNNTRGLVLGAVGISGAASDTDEQIALAAIKDVMQV
jgi:uncharacterized protein GlcG (DUF336 family)